MKTHIVLALDTRRPKADGTFPILLRLIHHRASTQITLGIYVLEKDWDDKKRVIKSSHKGTDSVTRLNNFLQKKKAEVIDIITKLDEEKKLDSLSISDLKNLIDKKPQRESFFSYTESIIDSLIDAKRIGNARAYRTTINVLKNFCEGKDLTFRSLDITFLKKFEITHLAKGNSINGLAVYLRTIRAIFNIAIKAGHIDEELYPFKHYSIKTSKTRKRAISMEAINRIRNLDLTPDHTLYHTRNMFLASFYMRGISFADLAQLKVSNIIDGRIYYQRSKTHKPYNIKVTDELRIILDLYISNKVPDDYIFAIIDREEAEERYKDIEWARKRFNKKLKKLASLCEIPENLTSYVSRHSFATRAKNLGIPIASISDMLGHENVRTTEIYLDTLSSDLLDDLHEKIIK